MEFKFHKYFVSRLEFWYFLANISDGIRISEIGVLGRRYKSKC
jgi:hypothetical protein